MNECKGTIISQRANIDLNIHPNVQISVQTDKENTSFTFRATDHLVSCLCFVFFHVWVSLCVVQSVQSWSRYLRMTSVSAAVFFLSTEPPWAYVGSLTFCSQEHVSPMIALMNNKTLVFPRQEGQMVNIRSEREGKREKKRSSSWRFYLKLPLIITLDSGWLPVDALYLRQSHSSVFPADFLQMHFSFASFLQLIHFIWKWAPNSISSLLIVSPFHLSGLHLHASVA